MRHIQIKPNSSNNKNNVGSSSGAKVTSVSQKSNSARKIYSEPLRNSKKRKVNENLPKGKGLGVQKHNKELDADKTQKKLNPHLVKKASVSVKKLKKPNKKFKKIGLKLDKKTNNLEKVLKRCKVFEKIEDNDGPPTLCETFSRITTMVAETVINEKENQRLTESLIGKVKRESESVNLIKSKTEVNSGEAVKAKKGSIDADLPKLKSVKKVEAVKKIKSAWPKSKIRKMKNEPKKIKSVSKKLSEKPALDNTENSSKILKDEDTSIAFGKGIGTRRKSTISSSETEQKSETLEANKTKNEIPSKVDNPKKRVIKPVTKKVVKKEKAKLKLPEIQSKKANEELKKNSDKGKDDQIMMKETSQKKITSKKEATKSKALSKNKSGKGSQSTKKKTVLKEVKSPKSKFGSETDGSNSDELTLNIIQKKNRKTKGESAKVENNTSSKTSRFQANVEENRNSVDEKNSDAEKAAKSKKVKSKKYEKNESTATIKNHIDTEKDKKIIKESESDTDEDMELKRIMAKKLGRNIKSVTELNKKKPESGKTTHDFEQRARRLKLFGFWSGPKRHRVASLNALAKVHCLYENESKGVLAEIEKLAQVIKPEEKKSDKKDEKTNKAEKKNVGMAKKLGKDSETEKLDVVVVNKRILRGTPGTRGAGKHWDMFTGDSTTSLSSGSSDECHSDTDKPREKKLPLQPSYRQKMLKKETADKDENLKTRKRRRNNEIAITMDLKDMVVRKRMASLNASAILAASYSTEKRSNRKDSSGTSTEDGLSSNEDNYRLLIGEGENAASRTENKKVVDQEVPEVKNKEANESVNPPECIEYKHKKHFWKTKVESLKKSSKEKRNSPSPILADFGVEKDLSAKVFEKEKNDEINDDKEKDKAAKLGYPPKKFLEGKLKIKNFEGKFKNLKNDGKDALNEKDGKRKYLKRKLCEDDVKNINIEKIRDMEKTDEYEYKSDSDNGQRKLIELRNTGGSNKKVAVIVNQDTDVTITGVYVNSTRSTHHEGFCSIAGMQYRISSTSHTQTEATAVLKTSTASEQTPSPTEPTNCASPRIQKSYTPLSALSNMQPPAGTRPHSHLPPPPHHHHHLCGIGQHRPSSEHYIGHGVISHQRPMSILSRRHGCSSAFTAPPHCSSHSAPGGSLSSSPEGEPFGSPLSSHGYFQPAGPLIHHHHASNAASTKTQHLNSSDSTSTTTSTTTTTTTTTTTESQPPVSINEEPSEATLRGSDSSTGSQPPPPPPPAAHHIGYPRGYPYQSSYYQGSYYPPPPQTAHYQPPPPSFHQHYHHHQDLCYPPGYPPSSYPPPPGSYRRFLQPPPGYYSPELTYSSSGPPSSQDHGAQQMVVPGSASSSYSAPLDPYPPPAPYYPGYSPGPGPACYGNPPSSRNLAFIEQTYQSCPCPMQLCPKNVHIGPLTGECKRPGALPLPPVVLQLPQEPPGAAGPPSPARGSAGMPPQPSPIGHTARPNWDGKTVKSISEIKWEESRTNLDLKPLNYKTEILNCLDSQEVKDLSISKKLVIDSRDSAKLVENEWNDLKGNKSEINTENFPQGLLAISSHEMMLLAVKTQETPAIKRVENEKKIIEIESGGVELLKNTECASQKQKNVFQEDSNLSPKRKKLAAKIEKILINKLEENKKRKRKIESVCENSENKVKKVIKSGIIKPKDENACSDTKVLKRNQKHSASKGKLLRDRNETVEWKEVIQNNIAECGSKEKREDDGSKAEADKIVSRRKSNQERSRIFLEVEVRSVRKSRSCSPTRSKSLDDSVISLKDDCRRKPEATKTGKIKTEVKSKGFCEHSKSGGKRKNISNNSSKGGKQLSIINKGVQNKSKKSKSDYPLGMIVVKKFSSKKSITSSPRSGISPKWSNGWSWDSESFNAKVYLTNDEPPVMRKCYTAMRHVEGDVIHPRDCILLKAGPRKIDLPFVAKVAALWENPDDGEMMVSLLWYYRPEHTDQGRQPSDQQDEIFASRHKDINSVACIEDKCFVLTYNEYCRYRKKVKRVEEGVAEKIISVPRLEQPYFRFQRQPPCVMAPDMVFFCRKVYDFRQKRLLKNPT